MVLNKHSILILLHRIHDQGDTIHRGTIFVYREQPGQCQERYAFDLAEYAQREGV